MLTEIDLIAEVHKPPLGPVSATYLGARLEAISLSLVPLFRNTGTSHKLTAKHYKQHLLSLPFDADYIYTILSVFS